MTKRWIALAMMILMLLMTACGEEAPSPVDVDETPVDTVPKTEAVTLTPETEYTVDGVATFSLFKVVTGDKVTATVDDAIYYENSHEGKTYVDAVFDVKSLKDKAVAPHELLSVVAKGADDAAYSSVLFATETAQNTELTQSEAIEPGDAVRLHAAIEVSEAETALTITVSGNTDTTYTLDYTLGETVSCAKEIAVGGTVQSATGNALTLLGVSFSKEVDPSDTSGYYSYYSTKDDTTAYVYAEMNVLNNGEEALPVDKAVGMTVVYPDKRVFNGFAVIEAPDGKGFVTDGVIEPGEVTKVLYLTEIPTAKKRVEVDVTIAFGTDEHHIVIGIPAVE